MVLCSKCKCGKAVAPPKEICPNCRNKMEKIELKNEGVVYTFTTSYFPPDGFKASLSIVIVELSNEARIICEGKGELKIGDKVLIEKEGEKYYAKRFE